MRNAQQYDALGENRASLSPTGSENVCTNREAEPDSVSPLQASSRDGIPAPAFGTEARKERPTGTKRASEVTKQVAALNKGADSIEKLVEASLKRTKIAENMLEIERQQSLVALFSMPGTEAAMQKRFIALSQAKALATLEQDILSTERAPLGSISSILNIE